VAERDSHSFETKWLEKGMCERASWRARLCLGVVGTGRRRCELHIVCFGP